MSFEIFSYTATVLIFTGLALCAFPVLRILRRSEKHPLTRSDRKAIALTVIVSVIGTAPAEWAALSWGTWFYNPARSLDTTFLGAEVETYLFAALVSFVVSLAAVKHARREDRRLASAKAR